MIHSLLFNWLVGLKFDFSDNFLILFIFSSCWIGSSLLPFFLSVPLHLLIVASLYYRMSRTIQWCFTWKGILKFHVADLALLRWEFFRSTVCFLRPFIYFLLSKLNLKRYVWIVLISEQWRNYCFQILFIYNIFSCYISENFAEEYG